MPFYMDTDIFPFVYLSYEINIDVLSIDGM